MPVRLMRQSDLDQVALVQELCYTEIRPESRESFQSKLGLCREGCMVWEDKGEIRGYVIAHPWAKNSIPPLNACLDSYPAGSDVLHLHDLAVKPEARGEGIALALFEKVVEQAKIVGLQEISLVSVQGSSGFWQKRGFLESTATPILSNSLRSYQDGASYMVMRF